MPDVPNPPGIDYRKHPQRYRIARGEQGVLTVEPYKSELLPHWRFRTPVEARRSAGVLHRMFLGYLKQEDFVGADMARKFIQMGWTRARRYANHASGRKYRKGTRELLPADPDPVKAKSAEIFFNVLQKAKANRTYQRLAEQHRAQQKRPSADSH
jgi:hypothetical protein